MCTKLFRQKLKLNEKEEQDFNDSIKCYLCNTQFKCVSEKKTKNMIILAEVIVVHHVRNVI